jgi:hypothetical protein
MKNSSFVNVLLAVLTASALASLVLCGLYISKARQLRSLSTLQGRERYEMAIFNQLANDVLEYSKTHPAINPIVDTYLKPKAQAAPAAPAAPASPRPASK